MSPLAPNNTNVLLGKGAIYFDRFDENGVSTGYFHLGNVSQGTLEFEDDRREMANFMVQSGGVYRKVTTKRNGRLRLTGHEFNPDNLALITMGDVQALTQAASSVTGEQLTATLVEGRYYQTAFRDISAVTLKQGVTTLVENTDYVIVDASRGIVRIIPGGANLTAGNALTADYTYAAIAAPGLDVVAPGSKGLIEGKLLFVGDPQAGPVTEMEAWRVSIEPDGGFDLFGEDFGAWSLTAEVLDDSTNHPTQPFARVIYSGTYR